MRFLLRLLLNGVAIVIAAYLIPGVRVTGPVPALIAGVILGLINAVIRPILKILTLPITILTLGLFTLVINALCFGLTALLVPGFSLSGFKAAFLGALLVGVVSWVLSLIFAPKKN